MIGWDWTLHHAYVLNSSFANWSLTLKLLKNSLVCLFMWNFEPGSWWRHHCSLGGFYFINTFWSFTACCLHPCCSFHVYSSAHGIRVARIGFEFLSNNYGNECPWWNVVIFRIEVEITNILVKFGFGSIAFIQSRVIILGACRCDGWNRSYKDKYLSEVWANCSYSVLMLSPFVPLLVWFKEYRIIVGYLLSDKKFYAGGIHCLQW